MSTGEGSVKKEIEMVKQLSEKAGTNLNIPEKPFETDLHQPGTVGLQLQDPPVYNYQQFGSASRQQVKNLIEQCLVNYQSEKHVVDILYEQHKIEPSYTRRVWQELEEQNQQYFNVYYKSLAVIEQTTKYNELLGTQADLMKQHGVGVQSTSSGLPITSLEIDRQPNDNPSSALPPTSDDQQSGSVP